MIQLEINNRKIGLVEIPSDAINIELHDDKGKCFITYHTGMGTESYDILRDTLPPGDYTIIGKGDEITDKEILEQVKAHNLTHSTTLVVEIK